MYIYIYVHILIIYIYTRNVGHLMVFMGRWVCMDVTLWFSQYVSPMDETGFDPGKMI
jgi:hypothetical protein